MTEPRSEEAGVLGLLPVTMGGKPYELRALTLRESRAWKRRLAEATARLEIPAPKQDPVDLVEQFLLVGDEERLTLLLEYDVDSTLGGRDAVETHMTQPELKAAVEAVLDAQAPFGEADAHSVAEAFGRPSIVLGALLRTLAAPSRPASSTSGPSSTGESAMPTSTPDGPSSSSSSDGPTPSDDSIGKLVSDGT